MQILLIASMRAVGSVFSPGMLGLFIYSIIATIVALILFVLGASALFNWIGAYLESGYWWAEWLGWVGSIGSTVVAWLFFPTIMPLIISFFDERIAHTIERHNYPHVIAQHPTPFWKELGHDARFVIKAILLNILILPLYLLIPLLPFYLLNGWLLGHEFFRIAAKRHITIEEVDAMRKRYGRSILAAGIILTFLATIPMINLLAPFWGVAIMVHLYQNFEKPAGSPALERVIND